MRTVGVCLLILLGGYVIGALGCFALGIVSGPLIALTDKAESRKSRHAFAAFLFQVAAMSLCVGIYAYFFCYYALYWLGRTGANPFWMLAACAVAAVSPAQIAARDVQSRHSSRETMTLGEGGTLIALPVSGFASLCAAGLWAFNLYEASQSAPKP